MSVVDRRYTITDLERLREGNPYLRYELVEGEVLVSPAPTTPHQRASRRFLVTLDRLLSESGLGEVFDAPYDVHFGVNTVVQPDLIVVLADQAAIVQHEGIVGVPALVIEILSPSSRRADAIIKLGAYARHGVPEYWLVDLEAPVVVVHWRPVAGVYQEVAPFGPGDILRSPTIPLLAIDLSPIFAGIASE